MPVIVVGLSLVLQAGLIVRDQVLVTHSAREGARVAAVDADADAASVAVRSAAGLDAGRLTVDVEGSLVSGERVRVEVTYRAPIVVPLLNTLVEDIDLAAAVTIRVE